MIPVYKKVFTRDFSLLKFYIWYKGEAYNPKPWSGKKQPFLPYIVFIREDGTVKSYYDPQGVEWIKNHIKEAIRKDNNFLKRLEREIKSKIKIIHSIYDNKTALSRKDLLRFVLNFEIFYPWAEAMWWLCEMDERELKGIDISSVLKLREDTNKLSVDTDTVVRKSLSKIFPKISNYIHVLTFKEVESKKVPSTSELKERDEGFIYIENKLYVGVDRKFIENKYRIKFEKENIEDNKKIIKGTIAYQGNVKGRVRRVMGHKHINIIKKGEILVSPMTMPDFLPAMKKAAAIITDEGGITCHAAIVSRELGIPCIIGTKIATKVLKDGDIVEVDANKGVVRIIKK